MGASLKTKEYFDEYFCLLIIHFCLLANYPLSVMSCTPTWGGGKGHPNKKLIPI